MFISSLTLGKIANAYDFELGGIYYVITSDSTVKVTCKELNNNSYSGYVTIPSVITYEMVNYDVNEIGRLAFNGCANLEGVFIPSCVTKIGDYAFSGCTSLKKVNIPNTVTKIGFAAFENCSSLVSANIPKGVKTLETGIFRFCTNLSKITIPESVTTIGSEAFDCCKSLENIELPSSLLNIGNWAFSATGLKDIVIPNSVASIGYSAFCSCYNLSRIEVEENNNFCSIDGVLFNKEKTKIIAYPNKRATTTYDIPEGVLGLEIYSFAYTDLKKVTIPSTLDCIANRAFFTSGLTEIKIPANVKSLEEFSLSYCRKLKTIVLSEGLEKIGRYAFCGCLVLSSITIPESVAEIGQNPFSGCAALTTINMLGKTPPGSVGFTDETYANVILYVPKGSLGAYQSAESWNKFSNIIEKDFSGVDIIKIAVDHLKEIARYDINGRFLTSPVKGVNIVKMSDGTMKKVIVK